VLLFKRLNALLPLRDSWMTRPFNEVAFLWSGIFFPSEKKTSEDRLSAEDKLGIHLEFHNFLFELVFLVTVASGVRKQGQFCSHRALIHNSFFAAYKISLSLSKHWPLRS
jgi:hypothetical protein